MPSTRNQTQLVQQWHSCTNCFDVLDTELCAEPDGMVHNTEDKPSSLLLAMPLEIRESIYEYFIQDTPVENRSNYGYWWSHNGVFFPSLL